MTLTGNEGIDISLSSPTLLLLLLLLGFRSHYLSACSSFSIRLSGYCLSDGDHMVFSFQLSGSKHLLSFFLYLID